MLPFFSSHDHELKRARIGTRKDYNDNERSVEANSMRLAAGAATMHIIVQCILLCYFWGLVSSYYCGAPQGKREQRKCEKSRREVCLGALTFTLLVGQSITSGQAADAAETIGKEENCNDSSCLGIWDGLLADCPHGMLKANAGCSSSQDDTPGIFSEPWDYSESEAPNNSLDWEAQMAILVPAIQIVSSRRGDSVEIVSKIGRYLRVLFVDGKTGEQSIGEFYFTPNDTTVQFRVGTTASTKARVVSSSLRNMERCELIRKELRYQKLPVLRNRKRTLFFGESEFDSFGPGSASLGPPAEMKTGELEGRQDVDPNLNIDLLQGFPSPMK
jgi:hypothetical protein